MRSGSFIFIAGLILILLIDTALFFLLKKNYAVSGKQFFTGFTLCFL